MAHLNGKSEIDRTAVKVSLAGTEDRSAIAAPVLPRNTEETFRALFEDAPIPYHEIDKDGLLVRINRAECELLHIRPENVIGRPVWEMVSPDQQTASREAVARKLREGKAPPPFERKYRGGDGVERIFEFHERVIVGPDGEIAGIRTAMIDLTESKNAQQQAAFQAGLLQQVTDAVVAVDEHFRVTFWNHAAEKLFGRSAADVLGCDYGEAVRDAFDDRERKLIREEFLKRGEIRREIVCRRASGEELIVELSATVLRDEAGRPCGAIGIHHDLTDRRRAEQALAASESRYKLAESILGIGTWEVDVESGRVTSSAENRAL